MRPIPHGLESRQHPHARTEHAVAVEGPASLLTELLAAVRWVRTCARTGAGRPGSIGIAGFILLEHAALAFLNDFCCGDGLAGVALRVVGAMHEETSDGCGQGFASYGAGLLEVGGREGLEPADRVVNSLSKF